MGQYIFRVPADTPDLDFGSLQRLLWPATSEHKIGTTVTVTGTDLDTSTPGIALRLYDTVIAVIRRESVDFPVTGDAHMATTEWIAKIVRDNAIGYGAGRIRRRKSDPLVPGPRGYAGPLAIDYDRDRLIEGRSYPVGDIGRLHRRRAIRQAELAAERKRVNAAAQERGRLDWIQWEAGRLRLVLSGDEQAAAELDELGMARTGQDAVSRLAELDAELARAAAAGQAERALTDPELDAIRPGLALDLAQLRKTGMDKPGDYLASTYED